MPASPAQVQFACALFDELFSTLKQQPSGDEARGAPQSVALISTTRVDNNAPAMLLCFVRPGTDGSTSYIPIGELFHDVHTISLYNEPDTAISPDPAMEGEPPADPTPGHP